ncbi:hypothetical protein HK101_007807 [Irineochytrium annulatum]|nr:hypothetical protein HK101_007807 [Irineochytrium annulatum]
MVVLPLPQLSKEAETALDLHSAAIVAGSSSRDNGNDDTSGTDGSRPPAGGVASPSHGSDLAASGDDGDALPSYTFEVIDPPKYELPHSANAFMKKALISIVVVLVISVISISLYFGLRKSPNGNVYGDGFAITSPFNESLNRLVVGLDGASIFGVTKTMLVSFDVSAVGHSALRASYQLRATQTEWQLDAIVACAYKDLFLLDRTPRLLSGNLTLYVWDSLQPTPSPPSLYQLQLPQPRSMHWINTGGAGYLLITTDVVSGSSLFLVQIGNATQPQTIEPLTVHQINVPGYADSMDFRSPLSQYVPIASSNCGSSSNQECNYNGFLVIAVESETETLLHQYAIPHTSTTTRDEVLESFTSPVATLNLTDAVRSFVPPVLRGAGDPHILALDICNNSHIAVVFGYKHGYNMDGTTEYKDGFLVVPLHIAPSPSLPSTTVRATATATTVMTGAIAAAPIAPTSAPVVVNVTASPICLGHGSGSYTYAIAWTIEPIHFGVLQVLIDGGSTTVNVYNVTDQIPMPSGSRPLAARDIVFPPPTNLIVKEPIKTMTTVPLRQDNGFEALAVSSGHNPAFIGGALAYGATTQNPYTIVGLALPF